jgi:hypothetical protein
MMPETFPPCPLDVFVKRRSLLIFGLCNFAGMKQQMARGQFALSSSFRQGNNPPSGFQC